MAKPENRSNVTLSDVAQHAGVSRATASRALFDSGYASRAARRAVLASAEELGFTPNRAARNLAKQSAEAIALVITESDSLALSDKFIGLGISGVSNALHNTEYQLILLIAPPDDNGAKLRRYLNRGTVDGAIVLSHHSSDHSVEIVEGAQLPTVFVGRPWKLSNCISYVDLDNRQAAEIATRHLIALGRKRIACIAGPADMAPVIDRTNGWRNALADAGLEPGPLKHITFSGIGAEEAMASILAESEVDGLFCHSDLLAAGALRAIHAKGLSVPADVAVVGFDDSPYSAESTPSLTTMSNSGLVLGKQAGELLLNILGNETRAAEPLILPSELIVRESAPPPQSVLPTLSSGPVLCGDPNN
ncbi:MAG: LacI family transcriptional regulator [Propionibacteriaceae bacterium]|nr:LacI family transcriptional regulator [Propionibacteriaceae bacterium]